MSLTSQGAGGTLSFPSPKSSREFKHKPICERIFCLSVIHFSLGLSSQTSGVLLAFKLACVSISLTDHLSIVKGVWCSFFVVHVSFQDLMYSHGAGGEGKMGNYSNIYRCFGNSSDHISTVDVTTTGCWPSDTFKRRGSGFLFLGETPMIFYPILGHLSSFSSTFVKGFAS